MLEPWEDFFIEKIEEGLKLSNDKLSSKERSILLSPIESLSDDNFSPEKGQKLNDKCIEALRAAYSNDMEIRAEAKEFAKKAGIRNVNPALRWRRMNEGLYKNSGLVLSGIVQNWHLSVGRNQEKQYNKGCLIPFIIIGASIMLFIILIHSLFG